MAYADERPCALGGRIVILPLTRRTWLVGHEPSGANVPVVSLPAAVALMEAIAQATTLAEADSHAPILPRGTVDLIDVFMADPENEPSPAGIAARRAMFVRKV